MFFYVYRPIGGKVQLAAPIKGITYGRRELALVRPYVIPFIETRRVLPTIGCFIGFCQSPAIYSLNNFIDTMSVLHISYLPIVEGMGENFSDRYVIDE